MTHVIRLFATMGNYRTCELSNHVIHDRQKLKLARYSDECEQATVNKAIRISWNLNQIYGSGLWQNIDNEGILLEWCKEMNKMYGVDTHWIEYSKITSCPIGQ